MKKLKFLVVIAAALITTLLFLSCSDDSTTPGTTNGWHPNLTFSPGQVFVYTNDSLLAGGSGHIWTKVKTTSTLQAQTTYQGQSCYPVTGVNYDTTTAQNTLDLPYWIRYDQSSGKFYQYGIQQLINPGTSGSWDLVGNFDAARGTSYDIATVNYPITITGYGTVNFTGPLKGKIADSTTIQTTANPPQPIKCYRIELTAEISGSPSAGVTITATIIVNYYLGYEAPTGLVELKSDPFGFKVNGVPVPALNQPGFDRKLFSHTP